MLPVAEAARRRGEQHAAAADDDDEEEEEEEEEDQSPGRHTSLSRRLKAISLDAGGGSAPNTPKKLTRAPGGALRRFASNTSIGSAQALQPLPEIRMLQEFGAPPEPVRVKAKGLLERRGSNASLTIDLGARPGPDDGHARSASTLSLTSFAACCTPASRRSRSNENLYVPAPACCPLSDDFRLHLQHVQYLQTAGNRLSVAQLRACCERSRVPQLHQEFWEVPLNLQEKCLVSGSQSRNRYRGILPNEHSRVRLADAAQAYIHANYVSGPEHAAATAYIATQGPMAHTCADFWQMVWQSKAECIVMLTQLVEKRRSKCELYFPLGRRSNPAGSGRDRTHLVIRAGRGRAHEPFAEELEDEAAAEAQETMVEFERVDALQFGAFRVALGALDASAADCSVRTLHVEHVPLRQTRTVRHFWYGGWQDHRMAAPGDVLRLALRVLDETRAARRRWRRRRRPDASPLVVHCSAGIGRTGCFLAVLNGVQQLRRAGTVDVLAIVCALRLSRGGMVQTAEQYELIHRVLALYAEQAALPRAAAAAAAICDTDNQAAR